MQACKALRDEGYRIVLVNSNPATIMTDPELADATYIEPITPEIVERIIARERAAMRCCRRWAGRPRSTPRWRCRARARSQRYGVKLIGANEEAIAKAEDRQLFRQAMDRIGLESPKSRLVNSLDAAREALDRVGLPAIIRPSFTLGGTGGGIAYNTEEFEELVRGGLRASPTHEVLIEESVLGWKEYELEVVRDRNDNCIIICSIENVDPMGVHTGDSVTVAPALTLTDKEYQIMRNAAIAVLREIGVDTGGSNVQFAVNPADGRLVIIEMNPRVSRSSALASKATGFPIAKIAAKLAVGYTLDELQNEITGVTPASFEPTIDYIVTKMPRFTFEKFPGAEPLLSTSMKSVGEAMAIGRSFAESVQKALRSMETGLDGFDEVAIAGVEGAAPEDLKAAVRAALTRPTPDRLLVIAQAYRHGLSTAEIHAACRYDTWFLERISEIVAAEEQVRRDGLPDDATALLRLKQMGFSDARLGPPRRRSKRRRRPRRGTGSGVRPVYKRIDTCAAEFPSLTPYMYSCYEGDGFYPPECEADPSERDKVVILGGGPNRIGQGIEFDYCCVHAAYSLREAGIETIMVNCNPETVSTDYDTSDRLYFEPLTAEDVIEIVRVEQSKGRVLGVIVQFGGQTPLNLAKALGAGGDPDPRHLARRDRSRRGPPALSAAAAPARAAPAAERHRHLAAGGRGDRDADRLSGRDPPVLRARRPGDGDRPRYGRAASLHPPRRHRVRVEPGADRPLSAKRDRGRCRRRRRRAPDGPGVYVAGIMEHIEEAGIHSGDSACSLPPYSLDGETIAEIERQTIALARALDVVGLMNVQFAIKDGEVYVLEVNPRASRTVPFVAKATGVPIAKIAARVMAGEKLADLLPDDQRRSRSDAGPRRGQGGGLPVRPLPRRRSDPRPGDALDRRGHGARRAISAAPSPSRSSAAAPSCRSRAASSSRCATATRRRWSSRAASSSRGGSSWSRHAAPRGSSARPGCRCEPSTRCRKAGPISSTRCAAAACSSSSIRPRARRRSPTASACAAPR